MKSEKYKICFTNFDVGAGLAPPAKRILKEDIK